MGKTNLLDTRTINFMELIGNGKIFRVPPYQRDYSWHEEQWEDLWDDILELKSNPDNRHYMGALVVEGKDDREFFIIDGQQRLATISILALAIIDALEKLSRQNIDPVNNTERARLMRNKFIGEKNPASLLESNKLFLNKTDDGFYQDYLVQLRAPINPRGLPKSNRLLWECFKKFCEWINKENDLKNNGEALATLMSEAVARQLLFLLITVDDELNAYTVFETLNARRLELSATDLLKNFLFSRLKTDTDKDALHRRWINLVNTVKQEHFPDFLRYHLLCEQPKIRAQQLFKLIRKKIENTQQVFDLITALEERAELFSAIRDENHSYWQDYPECKQYIRILTLFKVRQMTPFLFAAWKRYSKEELAKVLKVICVISFRYNVVCGFNTNELEPVYHKAAKAALDGAGVGNSLQALKKIYVPDETFEQSFSLLEIDTKGQRKHLVKYILCELEKDTSGKTCDFQTDPATIEHVLPENPDRSWDPMFPADKWGDFVYRIGNLSLLEPSLNRAVGNKSYLEKVDAFSGSAYRLSFDISQSAPEEWTPPHLAHRQRKMAKRATHVWRVDFSDKPKMETQE